MAFHSEDDDPEKCAPTFGPIVACDLRLQSQASWEAWESRKNAWAHRVNTFRVDTAKELAAQREENTAAHEQFARRLDEIDDLLAQLGVVLRSIAAEHRPASSSGE